MSFWDNDGDELARCKNMRMVVNTLPGPPLPVRKYPLTCVGLTGFEPATT
jgi:hypothetical protein